MIEVHPELFVAGDDACRCGDDGLAVLHACKHPCHQRAVGYVKSLPATHPSYLHHGSDVDMYLNLIDPQQPLFKIESFVVAMRFLRDNTQAGRRVLVHCNQGESRAPSLALLHMAKNLGVIPGASYERAAEAFRERYRRYKPGLGIMRFLSERWAEIG